MSQKTVRKKPRRNKKYRFQLLHDWLTLNYAPSRVLDVGGGKGLLSYLLNKSGWEATVADPIYDFRPMKYRDIQTREQTKLTQDEQKNIPRIIGEFTEGMVENYDLIVGLHAHGSNMQIIDACAKYDKDFLLLPCCVIGEPIEKVHGMDWIQSLVDYAQSKGFAVKKKELFFKGQNILIYTDKNLNKI